MRNRLRSSKLIFILISFAFFLVIAFLLYNSWQNHKLDGIDGWLFSLFTIEDTMYSKDYSDDKFEKIKIGMPSELVIDLLGKPLEEAWYYKAECGLAGISLKNDIVYDISMDSKIQSNKIKVGMQKDAVIKAIGPPLKEIWFYSESPESKSYSERTIILKNAKVSEIIHEYYVD